jgi:pimeloyl-ACP methyl ester carboxylesterase
MIRRILVAAGAVVVPLVTFDLLTRRASRRLLDRPRTLPDEASLGPELDALGGEVVRIRARDGLRLSGRWVPADAGDADWKPEPHEAILLLHGATGSVAPHLVEHGPNLRRTAAVLGLDFRGHGGSDESPTTFGLREVEDIAGALAWLGERGIERVTLVGFSMGGIAAIASVAVLGDGSLVGTDIDPDAPAHVAAPRRPRILAVVADSAVPELETIAVPFIPGPAPRMLAARVFDSMARTLGGDPRETEPIRVIGLLEGVDVLLISGDLDPILSVADANRLAAAGPPGTEHWIVPGADHRLGHRVDPAGYEARVTGRLRGAFLRGREADL